jgi:hypothetical protein
VACGVCAENAAARPAFPGSGSDTQEGDQAPKKGLLKELSTISTKGFLFQNSYV